MSAIAARGRGIGTSVLAPEVLAELDAARDVPGLAAALARAELPAIPAADALEQIARERVAKDLRVLERWSDALGAIELDEDRRSVRAIVRGLAARAPAARRLIGTVPTRTLPAEALAEIASAPTLEEIAERMAEHPYARIFTAKGAKDGKVEDLLAIEIALARRFAELARSRDRAMRTYVRQVIDTENAASALLIAARGGGVDDAFVEGGDRISREVFETASKAPGDVARTTLATALAGTPLAAALFAPTAGALEDAALAWQLETQRRLRRILPLGLAPALYALLRRRDEARHLRRAAWRIALGGGA